MKQLIAIAALFLGLFYLSGAALATNMVSTMATEKGGLKVTECAKNMGGLDQCVAQSKIGSCKH